MSQNERKEMAGRNRGGRLRPVNTPGLRLGGRCSGLCRNTYWQSPGANRLGIYLVALHRGFDELMVPGAQGWQRFGIDQYLDAPGHAGLASDQPAAFEREHHLVD